MRRAAIVAPVRTPVAKFLGSLQSVPVEELAATVVHATIERAATTLGAAGKTFEQEIYAGAGHGFLRQQSGQDGANLTASRAAWQRTVAWFREHLEA